MRKLSLRYKQANDPAKQKRKESELESKMKEIQRNKASLKAAKDLKTGKQPKQLSEGLDKLVQDYRGLEETDKIREGLDELQQKYGRTGSVRNKAAEIKKRFDSFAMKLKGAKRKFELAQKALGQVLDNSDRYSRETILKVRNHYNQARKEYQQALANYKKIN